MKPAFAMEIQIQKEDIRLMSLGQLDCLTQV
jgi:hypothetical protein